MLINWTIKSEIDSFTIPNFNNVQNNYRLELYETTTKLFNYYQNFHVRKTSDGKHVIQKFLDIPYEYRPLCNGLHELYIKTKQKTDKRKVIHYVNNLQSAQLLFVINYKYRVEK